MEEHFQAEFDLVVAIWLRSQWVLGTHRAPCLGAQVPYKGTSESMLEDTPTTLLWPDKDNWAPGSGPAYPFLIRNSGNILNSITTSKDVASLLVAKDFAIFTDPEQKTFYVLSV